MPASIPGNKLQQRMNEQHRETMAPGTGDVHSAVGVLEEVYDMEKLENIVLGPVLKRKLEQNPGLLFARVRLPNQQTYLLPFKDPEDQVYSTYGNGFLLEGKPVKVSWKGMSIDSGSLELARSWLEPHLNLARANRTYDIGSII